MNITTREITDKNVNGNATILIVDDENIVLEVGLKVLEKLGYSTVGAENGKDAIDIYEAGQGKIDLVILDMVMPDMDGGDIYEHLRIINPDVKVLLSSGYNLQDQVTDILKRGFNGFIQKPFSITQLSKSIEEVLGQE